MLFSSSLKKVILFVCTVAIAGGANAALVSYDEAVNGNLGSLKPYTEFVFDTVGENTVKGTANWMNQDGFTFSVAPGFQLVGLTVDVVGLLVSWDLYSGPDDTGIHLGYFGNGTSDVAFWQSFYQQLDSSVLPLSASTYAVAPNFAASAANGGYNPYTLRFTVARAEGLTVPEPGTLALFGAGLAVLLVLRKRQQV